MECVKPGYKLENDINMSPSQTNFSSYEQHVSPLDPNMSSVARYSPVYSDATTPNYTNPVIVHHLTTTPENDQEQAGAYVNDLTSSVASAAQDAITLDVSSHRYLQMMGDEEMPSSDSPPTDGLQLVPDAEQEVELLITDQTTGISYSVSTQEFLVERCLEDDQQLLDALVPGPLLDSDLLTLDDNALKSQLMDNVEQQILPEVSVQPSDLYAAVNSLPVKLEKPEQEEGNGGKCEILRRSKRQSDSVEEDGMCK